MATITKKRLQDANNFAAECGNAVVQVYSLVTNSSGAAVGSNSASAIGNGDKVRIGILPAGLRLDDALFLVSDAFTALVTADIGFEYMDGVDSTDVPQDADYFGVAFTLHTAGRYPAKNTAVRPVVLPKPAWLIVTTGGAANAAVGVLDVIVRGENVGV
jgi:hypothetical protein